MEPSNKVEHPGLGHRVLEYFRRNARAMDSADGVARFWVGEQVGLVERCLIDLHHQGLLDKRTIAGTDFYSLPAEPASAVGREPHTDTEDAYPSLLASLVRTMEDLRPEIRDYSTRVAETATLIAHLLERIRAQSRQQHDSCVVKTLCRLVEYRKVH